MVLAETGKESMTAHRILQIKQYVGNEDTFLLTYGDGLGDIDINAAVEFHKEQGRLCTITGVHPPGRFGELGIRADSVVTEFNEKPQSSEGYINGGIWFVAGRFLIICLMTLPLCSNIVL